MGKFFVFLLKMCIVLTLAGVVAIGIITIIVALFNIKSEVSMGFVFIVVFFPVFYLPMEYLRLELRKVLQSLKVHNAPLEKGDRT